jgi:hypothetical protein
MDETPIISVKKKKRHKKSSASSGESMSSQPGNPNAPATRPMQGGATQGSGSMGGGGGNGRRTYDGHLALGRRATRVEGTKRRHQTLFGVWFTDDPNERRPAVHTPPRSGAFCIMGRSFRPQENAAGEI